MNSRLFIIQDLATNYDAVAVTRNESDILETFKLFESTNNTLKTIPYASASLGINGLFIGGFIIYLFVFLLFVMIVKFQNYASCQSDNDEQQDEGPPSHIHQKNQTKNPSNSQDQPTTPSNMFPSLSSPKGGSTPRPKQQQQVNRNQKIMLFMVSFLVFIQLITLITRMVADSLAITLRTEFYSIYGKIVDGIDVNDSIIETFYRKLMIFHIFVSADLGFTKGNFITVLVILNFIQQVFITTCKKVGALKEKPFKVMTYLLNGMTVLYIFVSFTIKALISVFYLLFKLDLTSDRVLLPIYMICLVVDLAMIVTQTIFFNANGFRVMKMIGDRQKSKASNGKDNKKSHYVKIMVLQSALTFCALLQILAIIFEPLTRQTGIMVWGPMRDFVNSFGILSFSIVVLFLYNPVLVEKVGKSKSKTKQGKTMSSMSFNESTRSTHSDSETTQNHSSHQTSHKPSGNFLTVDYHYKDTMSVGSSSSSIGSNVPHNDEVSSTISVVDVESSNEQYPIELQSTLENSV